MSSLTHKVAEVRPAYANGDPPKQRKIIEQSFPFVEISEIAERQSWRKDVYQPVYYIMMARLLATLSRARDLDKILSYLSSAEKEMGTVVERVWKRQNPRELPVEERQIRLF
jgi:hypothetical protein